MKFNGVILQKLNTLETVTGELRSVLPVTEQQLAGDWRTRRAVERDLQIAVEVIIDVCQRLISLAGQTPATSGGAAVEKCVALGALSGLDPYRKMIQFRNHLVHRYDIIEPKLLAELVNLRLGDFDQFRQEILDFAS